MKYKVIVSCISHKGLCRINNQDNFICDRQYMKEAWSVDAFPIHYEIRPKRPEAVGVFDGMGGEECGEIASAIAAETASEFDFSDPQESLRDFCFLANENIYHFAQDNGIGTMGTTASMLVFDSKGITLCNIGDSKILRFSHGELEQISVDHIVPIQYGSKPPLSQNLGIPPEDIFIDPYISKGYYQEGDLYIICSDGLTDMVTPDEMIEILNQNPPLETTRKLVNRALENGGRDNITVIMCCIERDVGRLSRWFGN